MIGVVVLALTVLPQLLTKSPKQVSLTLAIIGTVVQLGVLLLLAVWIGVVLSKPLGLGAPAIETALSGSAAWPVLKHQFLPAVIVGIMSGGVLLLAQRMAPAELLALGQTMEIPLAAKVLYGGVTEEVLMRWGLMTSLIWFPWRFVQKKSNLPRNSYVIGAILVAAMLFGVGHLPAAVALGVSLTAPVVAFIIIANSLPAILFGCLYWRYGIEAAIIAHALAHVAGVLIPAV